tara:strand:- start:49 stop:450 length:402 start_codon:yes stop_codon:yes gene_type:complete
MKVAMLLISVLFLATAVEARPWGGGRQLAKGKPNKKRICEAACMQNSDGAYKACAKWSAWKKYCCTKTCKIARKSCKDDVKSECPVCKKISKEGKAECKKCIQTECKNGGVSHACDTAQFCKKQKKPKNPKAL